jgi:hypothetical protein
MIGAFQAGVISSLWTPANLTSLLWLDASDSSTITQSSGLVSQWSDKSGNARHVTSSLTNRPEIGSVQINGLPSITFDGSNDCLWIQNDTSTRNIGNVICSSVLLDNGSNNVQYLHASTDSAGSTRYACSLRATGNKFGFGGRRLDSNQYAAVNSANDISSVSLCLTVSMDYSAAHCVLRKNGNLDYESDILTAGNTSDTTSAYLSVGALKTGGSPVNAFKGSIGELLMYRDVSAISRVEYYLKAKWGIA